MIIDLGFYGLYCATGHIYYVSHSEPLFSPRVCPQTPCPLTFSKKLIPVRLVFDIRTLFEELQQIY